MPSSEQSPPGKEASPQELGGVSGSTHEPVAVQGMAWPGQAAAVFIAKVNTGVGAFISSHCRNWHGLELKWAQLGCIWTQGFDTGLSLVSTFTALFPRYWDCVYPWVCGCGLVVRDQDKMREEPEPGSFLDHLWSHSIAHEELLHCHQ